MKMKKSKKGIVSTIVDRGLIGIVGASLYTLLSIGAPSEVGRYLTKDSYGNMSSEQLVRKVDSWEGARDYIMQHLKYSFDETNYGFEDVDAPFDEINRRGKDDCDGGATAGATLLSNDPRYKVSRMILLGRDSDGISGSLLARLGLRDSHAITIVYDSKTQKYGSLGINAVDNIKPVFDSPESVFRKLNRKFLWQFKDFELKKYDPETLLKGEDGFEKHNSWIRSEKKKDPTGHFYTAVEKPYSEGNFVIFDGELLKGINGGERILKSITDPLRSYSASGVEERFAELSNKRKNEASALVFFYKADLAYMQIPQIGFKTQNPTLEASK